MIPSSERMTITFIHHPGLSGPFGALMDEYARAAEDFCRVVERFDLTRFDAERPSNNPNTVSPRAICLHVIGAAHRYAHYIRKARRVDFVERYDADPAHRRSKRPGHHQRAVRRRSDEQVHAPPRIRRERHEPVQNRFALETLPAH